MSTADEKLQRLEEATAAAASLLADKESQLAAAVAALAAAKAKLRSLDPAAQQALQVTDTDLPELIDARMRAEEDRDEARTRHDTNQRYLAIFREKAARER